MLTLLSFALTLVTAVSAADAPEVASVDLARDRIRGDRNATASLIVYSDFECPFCKKFHGTLDDVREQYPHIRIVYRNYPLAFHKNALPAAKAAECVASLKGDAAYWSFLDGLFALQSLGTAALKDLAVAQGVSTTDYDSCLESKAIADKIAWDKETAALAGVTGTPNSFLVKPDGIAIKINGAVSADALKKHLDKVEKRTALPAESTRVRTTKRKPRVREAVTVKGVRRWK